MGIVRNIKISEMASSLLRLTRRTAASAFRLPSSIRGGRPSEQRNPFDQQCFTITTASSPFSKAWLKRLMSKTPLSPPALYTLEANHLTVQIPGWKKRETDQGLCLTLHMPGVLEPEHVDATIDGKHLLIQAKTDDDTAVHLAGMELPLNFNKNRDFIAVMKGDGMFKLTLPLVEKNQMAANFHAAWRLEYSVASYDLTFNDRKYLRQTYSSVIDYLGTVYMSFTLYKKVTAESLYFQMSHGVVKVESTSEGLCVSLNMPGLEIEDVKCSFEDDDLFMIDGKKEMEHYIGGIHVPDGYQKNNSMIKTEMNEGMYKATLPRVGGAR